MAQKERLQKQFCEVCLHHNESSYCRVRKPMCIPSVWTLNFHFVLSVLRQTLMRKRKVFEKLKCYRNTYGYNC